MAEKKYFVAKFVGTKDSTFAVGRIGASGGFGQPGTASAGGGYTTGEFTNDYLLVRGGPERLKKLQELQSALEKRRKEIEKEVDKKTEVRFGRERPLDPLKKFELERRLKKEAAKEMNEFYAQISKDEPSAIIYAGGFKETEKMLYKQGDIISQSELNKAKIVTNYVSDSFCRKKFNETFNVPTKVKKKAVR